MNLAKDSAGIHLIKMCYTIGKTKSGQEVCSVLKYSESKVYEHFVFIVLLDVFYEL